MRPPRSGDVAGVTTSLLRWAVVRVRLDPVEGHEQAGQRPVLVASYEPFHSLGLLTVVPITAARTAPRFPGDAAILAGEAGLSQASVIVCSPVRTVASSRVVTHGVSGTELNHVLPLSVRRQVRDALAHHLTLDVRADVDGADGVAAYMAEVSS